MKFKKIEIELSSKCNAACPGCKRVSLLRKGLPFEQHNLEFSLIKKAFDNIDIGGTEIYLCGVLGDPVLHPQIVDVVKYFLDKDAKVSISTNASLRPIDEWKTLGKLSHETGRLEIKFAVDGLSDTNHIYRVNTDWNKIEQNMRAYSSEGGTGNWIFIAFNHNSHQIEDAKNLAEELKFKFSLRQSTRNSDPFYMKNASKKQKQQTNKDEYTIPAAMSEIEHPFINEYKKLGITKKEISLSEIGKIKEYQKRKPIPKEFTNNLENKIDCKFIHGQELFISATGILWPCCFLWDEYLRYQEFYTMLNKNFGIDWNNLHNFSIEEIVKHKYYDTLLEKSWDIDHPLATQRCWISCAVKGKLRNHIKQLN